MECCEQYQNQMLDYVYDLLDEGERTALQQHLSDCADCPSVLAAARRQQGLLAKASKLSFRDVRFERPVVGVTLSPAVLPFPVRSKRRRVIGWAVAAAVVVGIGGFGTYEVQKWISDRTNEMVKPPDNPDPERRDMSPAGGNTNPGAFENLGSNWGREVRGLAASITLDRTSYHVGEPIVVKYRKRNVGKEPIGLWQSGFWVNHRVIVRDTADQDVPHTDRGMRSDKKFAPRSAREPSQLQILDPDKEEPIGPDVDLAAIFNLTQPGKYTVNYIYEEHQSQGWEGVLESNPVKFEITK